MSRFKIPISLLIFLLVFAVPFLGLNARWMLQNPGQRMEVQGIEWTILGILCLLSWLSLDYHTRYARRIWKPIAAFSNSLAIIPGVPFVLAGAIILILLAQLDLEKKSPPKRFTSFPQPLTSVESNASLKQKHLQFKQQMEDVLMRDGIRTALNLKIRTEDELMLRLAGGRNTQDIRKVPYFKTDFRQKLLWKLLQLERDAGYAADFREANLSDLDLSRKLLKENNLEDALAGADFTSANLSGTRFRDTNLQGAIFTKAIAYEAYFYESNLTDANFTETNLKRALFSSAQLHGARMMTAHLLETTFLGAHLDGAIVDSKHWIHDYNTMNPPAPPFQITHYEVVEETNAEGKTIYVCRGTNPPARARKP